MRPRYLRTVRVGLAWARSPQRATSCWCEPVFVASATAVAAAASQERQRPDWLLRFTAVKGVPVPRCVEAPRTPCGVGDLIAGEEADVGAEQQVEDDRDVVLPGPGSSASAGSGSAPGLFPHACGLRKRCHPMQPVLCSRCADLLPEEMNLTPFRSMQVQRLEFVDRRYQRRSRPPRSS